MEDSEDDEFKTPLDTPPKSGEDTPPQVSYFVKINFI